jgi:hypothetical protein
MRSAIFVNGVPRHAFAREKHAHVSLGLDLSERVTNALEDFVPVHENLLSMLMDWLRIACGWTDHERISQQGSGTGMVAEQNPQRHARQRSAVRQPIQRDTLASSPAGGVAFRESMLTCWASSRS